MFEPLFRKIRERVKEQKKITPDLLAKLPNAAFKRIGIALEGDYKKDLQIVNLSIPVIKSFGADILLIHCVQTASGLFHGNMVADRESFIKENYLKDIAELLIDQGLKVSTILGGGEPEEEIVRIARESKLDMIITGSHGHRFISDLIYGATVDGVRHRTRLPVLAFPIN
jgi:manganese transport protein